MSLIINGTTGIQFPDSSNANSAFEYRNVFGKSDPSKVAFAVASVSTATTQCILSVDINLSIYNFAAGTNIVMPTLTAGTDYAIFACTDGTIRADANFTAATGYTVLTCRKIGGFHYAPGGNAVAATAGDRFCL